MNLPWRLLRQCNGLTSILPATRVFTFTAAAGIPETD
jgi:hypothetical protein